MAYAKPGRFPTGLFPVFLLALLLPATVGGASGEERRVAVFDFQLIDSSLQGEMSGPDPVEATRLDTMAPMLRAVIDADPGFAVIDTTPAQAEADGYKLDSCGNCAVRMARGLGADIVVIGNVQKVSNLILNINAYAFDVGSGKPVGGGSTDIRSNSDESWHRGLDFLWETSLSKQFAALAG